MIPSDHVMHGQKMIDLPEATDVEFRIDSTRKLWLNVVGVCAVRIGYVDNITIDLDDALDIRQVK